MLLEMEGGKAREYRPKQSGISKCSIPLGWWNYSEVSVYRWSKQVQLMIKNTDGGSFASNIKQDLWALFLTI